MGYRRHLYVMVICLAWADATRGLALAGSEAATASVFGRIRQSQADVLWLNNGDRLSGSIAPQQWQLTTTHGPVVLEQDRLAAIRFGPGEAPDIIATVNSNLLAGQVAGHAMELVLPFGPVLNIPMENIEMVVFRQGAGEGVDLPARQFMRLKSGEILTGRITPDPLEMRVGTETREIARAELAFLGPAGEQRPLSRAVLQNDDVLDGELQNETVQIELDAGPVLTIPVCDIDFLVGPDGVRPREPERIGGVRVVRIHSIRDVNVGLRGQTDDTGLQVAELAEDSPFQGALQAGDVITRVAGGAYGEGALTRAVWDMLLGNRAGVELQFTRAGREERIVLMRAQDIGEAVSGEEARDDKQDVIVRENDVPREAGTAALQEPEENGDTHEKNQ